MKPSILYKSAAPADGFSVGREQRFLLLKSAETIVFKFHWLHSSSVLSQKDHPPDIPPSFC